jgi:hypothetical protein
MSLQPSDTDRLMLGAKHASAFTQFLHRTYPRACRAQQIGFEDGARGPPQIFRGDFLDELRYVDVRWAGMRARRVIAHQAPRRFDRRFVLRQRWQKFAERIRPRRALRKSGQPILLLINPEYGCITAKNEGQKPRRLPATDILKAKTHFNKGTR